MADDADLGLKKQQRHQSLMRQLAERLNDSGYVLKGGTAILLTRDGLRHSVDLDFDAARKTNINKHVEAAFAAAGIDIVRVNVYKNTDEKQTLRFQYSDPTTGAKDTLKLETRIQPIDASQTETVNGIRTYKLPALYDQKLNALADRDASRDLRDIAFMLTAHGDKLSADQLCRTAEVLVTVEQRLPDFAKRYAEDHRVPGVAQQATADALATLIELDRLQGGDQPPLMPAVKSPDITSARLLQAETEAGHFEPGGQIGKRLLILQQLSEAATGNPQAFAAEVKSIIDNPATATRVYDTAQSAIMSLATSKTLPGSQSWSGTPDARRTQAIAAVPPLADALETLAGVRYGIRKDTAARMEAHHKQLAVAVKAPSPSLAKALAEPDDVARAALITGSKALSDEVKLISGQLDQRLTTPVRAALATKVSNANDAEDFAHAQGMKVEDVRPIVELSAQIAKVAEAVRIHEVAQKQTKTFTQGPTITPT